ncbi:MAG TPA: hypothetical protein VJJ81_00410 [Candidatus Babeliales bacterium]|nr:hypothetical protein [Candidatus Babeliales bacterium]
MSKFNKIIATAVLLVVVASNVKAAEVPVAAVTEAVAVAAPAVVEAVVDAAPVVTEVVAVAIPASATEAAAANLVAGSTTAPVAGWTVKGKLGEAGKWISAKGEAAAKTTKDFGTSSVTTIKNNPKTSAAVAVVVIAGVSYAIYKYNQSKAKKACNA